MYIKMNNKNADHPVHYAQDDLRFCCLHMWVKDAFSQLSPAIITLDTMGSVNSIPIINYTLTKLNKLNLKEKIF